MLSFGFEPFIGEFQRPKRIRKLGRTLSSVMTNPDGPQALDLDPIRPKSDAIRYAKGVLDQLRLQVAVAVSIFVGALPS